MNGITFFAASRDQLNYFTHLHDNIKLSSSVVWYKSLRIPSLFIYYPVAKLWQQAKLLTKRKKNSRKGKNYPVLLWPVFTSFSFIQACWLYAVYIHWLKRLPDATVGVWNGKKFRQAILVIALKAMGKKPIFFETGPLPGVSAIDPKGVNFYSSIPNDVEFYLKRNLSENHLTEQMLEKEKQATRPGNLPKRYILVPFQVVEDSNIYLHSDWIHNMRQFFTVCESISNQLGDDISFVFKEHPACDEEYTDLRRRQSAKLQFIDDVTTPELVHYSEAVITVNSTVGIEGLIAGKKIFVLGDALFGIEGITYPVKTEKALLDCLTNLQQLTINQPAVNSFLDYLKFDYAIPQNAMQNPGKKHWQAAEKRLTLLLAGRVEEALNLTVVNGEV